LRGTYAKEGNLAEFKPFSTVSQDINHFHFKVGKKEAGPWLTLPSFIAK
jgi:hypothetical protein